MSELELTPEQTAQTEQTKRGRRQGSKNRPKTDWYARREEIWDKMNAAIDRGAPPPAVIRALQSQLDTCNLAIAQVHDEQKKARARRELTRHAESIFEVFDNTFPEFPGSEFDSAEYKNRRTMRERQKQQKVAQQQAQKQYLNRGAGSESNLQRFQALYDADERLMAGNSVDARSIDPQQFNVECERAGNAFLTALKNSGHELTDRGLKKLIEYIGHHYVDEFILDTRRADVLCAAFNRASQIGLFEPSDFVSGVTAKTAPLTGRDREEADRAEYRANLRAEIGNARYEAMYGHNGQNPLGARRPND